MSLRSNLSKCSSPLSVPQLPRTSISHSDGGHLVERERMLIRTPLTPRADVAPSRKMECFRSFEVFIIC